jgi:hypothetical protein
MQHKFHVCNRKLMHDFAHAQDFVVSLAVLWFLALLLDLAQIYA